MWLGKGLINATYLRLVDNQGDRLIGSGKSMSGAYYGIGLSPVYIGEESFDLIETLFKGALRDTKKNMKCPPTLPFCNMSDQCCLLTANIACHENGIPKNLPVKWMVCQNNCPSKSKYIEYSY